MSLAIYHEFLGWLEADAPQVWSPPIVSARLVESMKVIANTTYGRPKTGFGSGWPTYVATWEDLIGRGDDARKELWISWSNIRPQYDAAALSRAEEAAAWIPKYLRNDDGAARVILAWATLTAARRPLQIEFRKRKWSMTTYRRKKADGLQKISDCLNRDRVLIREAEIETR
jgi:hypothetical protein